MPSSTVQWLSLGNMPSINGDPDTNVTQAELEGSGFVGTSYTGNDELSIVSLTGDTYWVGYDAFLQSHQSNVSEFEYTDPDGNAISNVYMTSTFGATIFYQETPTSTPIEVYATVVQMSNGDVFLRPNYNDQVPWENLDTLYSITIDSVNEFGDIDTIESTLDFSAIIEDDDIVCFASGTTIVTSRGTVVIDDLVVGDCVVTRDHGPQPIRWIGKTKISKDRLLANNKLYPIRIRQHALGSNVPSSDLLISPQHRVLVRSEIAQKMFGAPEVLVAAKQLCQLDGVDIAFDVDGIEYFHMIFDAHEVVISNGAETESLYTGPQALKSLGKTEIEEIFAIFPELQERDYAPTAARVLVQGRKGRQLAVRHKNNNKALVN